MYCQKANKWGFSHTVNKKSVCLFELHHSVNVLLDQSAIALINISIILSFGLTGV